MNTWTNVIAELANIQGDPEAHAEAQAYAQSRVKTEYVTVKKQSELSELAIKNLETDYLRAKARLIELESQAQQIELATQCALERQQAQKALTLATEIAKLNINVFDNRQQVAHIEHAINELKGAVSHNRYNLFRLEQQLDTLAATSQLQQAQSKLAEHKGIRTALHSIAAIKARSASNDGDLRSFANRKNLSMPQNPCPPWTSSSLTSIPESAEQILQRLRKSAKL
jgi:uncharacterized coiled-coil protein SlyX